MSNNLLQVTSTVSRAESSLSSAIGNDFEIVRQLRNRISQMKKDLVGIHAMAAVVKKKGELAAEVEQYALDRLQTATESLSCKQSMFLCLLYSFDVIAFL
jgi:predicted Zn-dependent protease